MDNCEGLCVAVKWQNNSRGLRDMNHKWNEWEKTIGRDGIVYDALFLYPQKPDAHNCVLRNEKILVLWKYYWGNYSFVSTYQFA